MFSFAFPPTFIIISLLLPLQALDVRLVAKAIRSGVVVPGEVGILLIYAPDFFIDFFNGPAKACT